MYTQRQRIKRESLQEECMARKSYQKGCVQKHNGIWTVRYYEKQHDGTEKRKRDPIDVNPDAKKKEAMRAAEPIMARVNDRNN